ncbi:MAG: galactokinase [bacterium]
MGRKIKLRGWIEVLEGRNPKVWDDLRGIYGRDERALEAGAGVFLSAARKFAEIWGPDREVGFSRAPGRLNTLGMHIDHRGGYVNPICLDREVVLCYEPRDDDLVEIHDVSPQFGSRSFRIGSKRPDVELGGVDAWLEWTQKLADERIAQGTNSDWVNKAKAAPIYLQYFLHPERKIRGLNAAMMSNIPPRAGLSSSSAIVVALMQALLDVNEISIEEGSFAQHCGVAEWFVGTRGGFGDHAAIRYGKLGMITHMKTTPELVIASYIPFPEGYRIAIFLSGVEADKTGAASQKFNEKTATYEIGEIFLRDRVSRLYPETYRRVVEGRSSLPVGVKRFYLADLVENLPEDAICDLLLELPDVATRDELMAMLPGRADELRRQFATHAEPPGGYRIRAVVTYGVSECARARKLDEVLKCGDIRLFGSLMNVSHDGDRVSGLSPELKHMKEAVDRSLPLHLQPGDYNCSIPEIDEMVDIALGSGAVGAQISGAGLGGSMMALVEASRVPELVEAMRRRYFEARGISERFLVANPIAGASLL